MRYAATRLGTIVCTLLVAACSDSPSEPVFDPVGTVSFAYSGRISGTFTATGEMVPQGATTPRPVTGATAYRQGDVLSVLAFRSTAASTGDGFVLVLGGVTGRGQVQLDPLACQEQSLAACRVGVFAPGVDAADLAENPDLEQLAANAWVMVLGGVKVTSYGSTRIRGTFSGTAVPASDQSLQNIVTISNGSFDVPVQPQ